jgi:hypothetical protein
VQGDGRVSHLLLAGRRSGRHLRWANFHLLAVSEKQAADSRPRSPISQWVTKNGEREAVERAEMGRIGLRRAVSFAFTSTCWQTGSARGLISGQ